LNGDFDDGGSERSAHSSSTQGDPDDVAIKMAALKVGVDETEQRRKAWEDEHQTNLGVFDERCDYTRLDLVPPG
jgi:hypothetical protein